MYMKKLLEDGQVKVFIVSNIVKGVCDVAQFILSAKGIVDLAIQNILQAALPWASIYIGLQVSTYPCITKASFLSTNIY
jgi:N-terminal domain of NWD NACHT-NTPase